MPQIFFLLSLSLVLQVLSEFPVIFNVFSQFSSGFDPFLFFSRSRFCHLDCRLLFFLLQISFCLQYFYFFLIFPTLFCLSVLHQIELVFLIFLFHFFNFSFCLLQDLIHLICEFFLLSLKVFVLFFNFSLLLFQSFLFITSLSICHVHLCSVSIFPSSLLRSLSVPSHISTEWAVPQFTDPVYLGCIYGVFRLSDAFCRPLLTIVRRWWGDFSFFVPHQINSY